MKPWVALHLKLCVIKGGFVPHVHLKPLPLYCLLALEERRNWWWWGKGSGGGGWKERTECPLPSICPAPSRPAPPPQWSKPQPTSNLFLSLASSAFAGFMNELDVGVSAPSSLLSLSFPCSLAFSLCCWLFIMADGLLRTDRAGFLRVGEGWGMLGSRPRGFSSEQFCCEPSPPSLSPLFLFFSFFFVFPPPFPLLRLLFFHPARLQRNWDEAENVHARSGRWELDASGGCGRGEFLFQATSNLMAASPPQTVVALSLLMLSFFDVGVQNLFRSSVRGHDGCFGECLFHSEDRYSHCALGL